MEIHDSPLTPWTVLRGAVREQVGDSLDPLVQVRDNPNPHTSHPDPKPSPLTPIPNSQPGLDPLVQVRVGLRLWRGGEG